MARDSRAREEARSTPADTAWRPVLALAGLLVAVEIAFASGYGYHRDELYFLEAGQHPAWGYVDQPPLTPLLGRLSTAVFGDSLRGLRVLPAVLAGVVVVLAALMARALGGDRRAQVWTAAATATSTGIVFVGHQLTTPLVDIVVWLSLVLLVLRLLTTRDPRWWLAIGALTGIGLQNKHLVLLLVVGLLAGFLATSHRELLRSPWFAGGAALALVLWAPNLWWQFDHEWPQIELGRHIAEEDGVENRITLVPLQLVLLSPLFIAFIVGGGRRLWADRTTRVLAIAYLVVLVLVLLSGGKAYYLMPLLVVLLAAGVVHTRLGNAGIGLLVAGSAVFAVVIALPTLPIETYADTPFAEMNDDVLEMTGWDDVVVTAVAEVHRSVPEGDRDRVVILTRNYGQAGAVDRFGPELGLPEAYSGHNGYADFRRPDEDDAIPLVVGYEPGGEIDDWFTGCSLVTRFDNGQDIENDEQGRPVVLCDRIVKPWAELWPEIRRIS